MGFGFLGSVLVLSLIWSCSLSQQPNTDGSYVSDFLHHTGVDTTQSKHSAGICSRQGVVCDAQQGHVIGLTFSNLGLSGTLPDNTIGKLSKLQSLDLSNNDIIGLSSDFWSLGSLKTLNLSYNWISGALPSNIGNFGLLETLDLSWNKFSGGIPPSISSLGSLQVLKLNQNGFQLSVPSGLLNCKSLVSMDLSWNRLNGTLPGGFLASFPKLRTLSLAGNGIEGSDSDFLNMKSITSLNMSRNQFQGSVVGVFQNQLEVIDLSWNKFDGHIAQVMNPTTSSSGFFNLSNLVYLDLSENQLSGQMYPNFSQFSNLKHLNLANNRFSAQEFPHIGMLLGVQYLNLSRTNLIGTIPLGVSQLSSLNVLDLSQNHLVGKIQDLSTKELRVLDVSYNNLSGEIPVPLLRQLSWMGKFNFSFNNLTLCASEISSNTLRTSFIGLVNSCPVAVKPVPSRKRTNKGMGFKLALALALSMICLLAGLLFLAFGCRRKTRSMWAAKQRSYKEDQNISGPFSFQTDSTTWVADVKQAMAVQVVMFEKPLLNLTFADLLSATSNFDRGTLLAEGRFGPVYRGYLPGGIHIAVKVLVHGSILTDQEAARVLEHLGRIKHPNLVPLVGYCLAGEQRIAIYDYMENGNLQNLLHDLPLGVQTTEDWSTDTWEVVTNGITHGSEGLLSTWRFRHKTALGTARALAFLHHGCSPPITHRDIKSSSVYLDSNLEPRLSDFGLVNIFAAGLDDEIFRGSPGYIPPEFSQAAEASDSLGNATPMSDVYGFGVVLFELITGKKPVGDEYPEKEANLVSWVRGLVRKNEAFRVIDPKIRETGSEDQMEEALKIGYLCTADLPSKRPSMQQIVGLLKDIQPVPHQ